MNDDTLSAEVARLAKKNTELASDRDRWRQRAMELATAVDVFVASRLGDPRDPALRGLRDALAKLDWHNSRRG